MRVDVTKNLHNKTTSMVSRDGLTSLLPIQQAIKYQLAGTSYAHDGISLGISLAILESCPLAQLGTPNTTYLVFSPEMHK